MNIKFDKELLKGIGNVSLKLGKTIVIEGTKAVILNAAATTIKTSFDEGFEGVKNLKFDDLLDGKDKKKKTKKSRLFAKVRNDKGEEEEIDVEIIDKDEKKVTE
jgi:hypothetical protein